MMQSGIQNTELITDGLVSIADAMKYLGVGKSTIYALIQRGELPRVKIGGASRIPGRRSMP